MKTKRINNLTTCQVAAIVHGEDRYELRAIKKKYSR